MVAPAGPSAEPWRHAVMMTENGEMPGATARPALRWVFIAVALGGIAVTIYARLDDWHRGRR